MQKELQVLAKKFGLSQKEWLVFFCALLAGLLLRFSLFGSTDLTWDEAFHILQGYKIATIFWANPLFLAALLAAAAIFVFFVLIKRNVFAAGLFSLILPVAVYAFGAKITFHPTHPPFFNLVEGITIALAGIGPELAGKLISTASSVLMALTGFFLAKHFSGKKAALIVFSLIMLSPYSVFYSSATYNTLLADSLGFLALALFFIGIKKNPKFVPVSGFFFVLAFFTRYTTLMLLLPVALLVFFYRKEVFEKSRRKNFAIFFLLVFSIVLALAPAISSSFGNFSNWDKNNTAKLYVRDIVHYSAFLVERFGEHPINPSIFFFAKEISIFYTPLLPAVFLAGTFYLIRKRKILPALFSLLFFAYFIFYSLGQSFQDPNYLLEMEFPLLLVCGIFLGEIWPKKPAIALAALLAGIFLFQGIVLFSNSNFHGLSETISKIPKENTIMTDFIDPVIYYRGYNLAQNNIVSYREYNDNPQSKADFAVLTEFYFSRNLRLEKELVKCFEIKSGEFTAFLVFAKSNQLCNEIGQ
ncbi:MAG: glycosyltransferase family 39 protein [archaeon]